MSVTCPGCGEINGDGVLLCTMCGVVLQRTTPTATLSAEDARREAALAALPPPPIEATRPLVKAPRQPRARPQWELDVAQDEDVVKAANWMFGIAGLSFINMLISLGGPSVIIALGLMSTAICDLVGAVRPELRQTTIPITLTFCGLYILFGIYARRGHLWAFCVGIALYTLDTLLIVWLLLLGSCFSLVGVVIHILVLKSMFAGLRTAWEARG